jgi:hypothetical protein
VDVGGLVERIDADLGARATPGRAAHERAYLESGLEHYGSGVPAVRAVAKDVPAGTRR